MSVRSADRGWVIAALDGTCGLSADEIGRKAWGLNRMCRLGLPVPPAFVINADITDAPITGATWARIVEGVHALGSRAGRWFGSCRAPLLVSVRSGAAASMPGMMETVLSVGINTAIERALAEATGNADHAACVHRRLRAQLGQSAPAAAADPAADPWDQLRCAIGIVRGSWTSGRAVSYRRHRGFGDEGGTPVTVQAMVYGDLDDRSGSGVVCSRNPVTGDSGVWGEWAVRHQGPDLVSGVCDPEPLDSLRNTLPDAYAALTSAAMLLEAEAGRAQEIEFTVEHGDVWFLQSREARLAPGAVARSTGREADGQPLAQGICAAPGTSTGLVVDSPGEACARAGQGESVILARAITSPADIDGMLAARAVITDVGGATSHAAVICREAGRPCVVGCGPGRATSLAGRWVTVDATSGCVWSAAPDGTDAAPAAAVVTQPLAAGDVRSPTEPALQQLYSRFLSLNSDIKALITARQLSKSQPAAQREILGQLAQVHQLALPLLTEIESIVPRMASYRSRLIAAADRIGAGDDRYVAGLFVDSYHTIWFELHQDLQILTGSVA